MLPSDVVYIVRLVCYERGGATACVVAFAAAAVIAAKYDGLQLDIEGLQVESKEGFELFVAACASALQNRASLSVTVYGPKLVVSDFSTYNVSS